jgi:hypothetical protein
MGDEELEQTNEKQAPQMEQNARKKVQLNECGGALEEGSKSAFSRE